MTNEKNYEPVRLKCNGATKDFPFDFQVHKNSKTLKYNDLIVTLINRETKEETILIENTDYVISVSTVGGNVTTNVAYAENYDIEISRKTSHFQEKNFSTSSGFQASEVENSFDKVSCSLQDMDYNIETFKKEYSAEINKEVEDFEDEINSKIINLNAEVDKKVERVSGAVEKLEILESSVATTVEQAQIATDKATEATEKAEEISATYDKAMSDITASGEEALADIESAADRAVSIVDNCASKDLDNLSIEGEAKLNAAIASGVYTKYAVNSVPNEDWLISGKITERAYDDNPDPIEITIPETGKYMLDLVGGGGGYAQVDGGKDQYSDTARTWHYSHAGGSGAYWRGILQFSQNDVVRIYIGQSQGNGGDGGDSYITVSRPVYNDADDTYTAGEEVEIVRAGGGKSGYVAGSTYSVAAAGGEITYGSTGTSYIVETVLERTGNSGYITYSKHI